MFWFDREDPRVVFMDIRSEEHVLCDGRDLKVKPDVIGDFRKLPFQADAFSMVVFDPPHLVRAGENSWMRKKYGVLNKETWRDDLGAGFREAFRVLKPGGTLIFKWNETQIRTSEILAMTDQKPAFGHPSGKKGGTHWICFVKNMQEAA